MNVINNNDNKSTQINYGTNNNNNVSNNNNAVINASYWSNNCNKSKKELNKQMDIFVNNTMNINKYNPFCNLFKINKEKNLIKT